MIVIVILVVVVNVSGDVRRRERVICARRERGPTDPIGVVAQSRTLDATTLRPHDPRVSIDREKTCATCGRSFAWSAKWARDWDAVRHCSERCRRSRPSAIDARIEALLLELVDARGAGKTICPSEVARAVRPDDWREWMERVRQAARRLVTRGELAIYQRGQVVDPDHARGAIRIGRAPRRPLASAHHDSTRGPGAR